MLKLLGFVTILQEAASTALTVEKGNSPAMQVRFLIGDHFAEKGSNCFLYEDFLRSDSGPIPIK